MVGFASFTQDLVARLHLPKKIIHFMEFRTVIRQYSAVKE